MEKRPMVLRAVLEQLGMPVDSRNMEGRIAIQRAVYLVQEAGLRMGYRFDWHSEGPYCGDLADEIQDLWKEETPAGRGTLRLRDEPRAVLGCLHGTVREAPKGSGLRRHEWLTALASMLYIQRRSQLRGKPLLDRFRALMPGLAGQGLRAAAALRIHGLIEEGE